MPYFFLKRFFLILLCICLSLSLSGCIALALAPVAGGLFDKPITGDYLSSANKQTTFNAVLRAINAQGSSENVDRETGTMKGSIDSAYGQEIYLVTVAVDAQSEKTRVVITMKLGGVMKVDLRKNSQDVLNTLTEEIKKQLKGSTFQKVT